VILQGASLVEELLMNPGTAKIRNDESPKITFSVRIT